MTKTDNPGIELPQCLKIYLKLVKISIKSQKIKERHLHNSKKKSNEKNRRS